MKSVSQLMPNPHNPSHPSRGAWIEILRMRRLLLVILVAPLTGCVD